MRSAVPLTILALLLLPLMTLTACKDDTAPSAVQRVYDNHADAIDRQAAQQPTAVAKHIYESRADAVREEGEDRKEGLKKAGIARVPSMPAVER